MNPEKLLYDYQKPVARQLAAVLLEHGAALDASDTGVGKTYVALVAAHLAKRRPLVVCPLSVVHQWRAAAEYLGVELVDAVNYERIKTGKTSWLVKAQKHGSGKPSFAWTLDADAMVVFDEAHRCGGNETQNSKICALTKAWRIPTLLLSATLADSPLRMKAAGYLLGLHGYRNSFRWMLDNGCHRSPWGGLEFGKGRRAMDALGTIHAQIFPDKGVRLRVSELPGFPETQITAETYTVASPEKIDAAYQELVASTMDADGNALGAGLHDEKGNRPTVSIKIPSHNALVEQLRARQAVETLKVPLLVELAGDHLADGLSVVLFVSFRDTVDALLAKFAEASVIRGDQSGDERETNVRRFQSGDTDVCVCTLGAGGTGLSLHDETGDRPRVSLISPSFNAVEIKQALGRVHRASAKSKSIQRLVYAAGTIEETIASSVSRKLNNLAILNDGDMQGGML